MNNFRQSSQFKLARWLIPILITVLLIIFVIYFFNQRQSTTVTTNTSGVKITGNDSAEDQYRSIIKDGKYVTSAARGISVSTETQFNAQSFENSINLVSKKYFQPSNFIFREGQILSGNTIQKWLGRYSDSNSKGLNPPDNGRTDNGRSPYYLQSIIEDDFVEQTSENAVSLRGMTIGFAMNRTDSYTKEQYGPIYSQDISKDEMVVQGKQIAEKVLKRLRAMKSVKNNLPILLVMYENATDDDLVGGEPYAYYYSRSGSNIGSWSSVDIKNVVFPFSDGSDETVGSAENTTFNNFQDTIKDFFPTLSTATATGRYENGINTGIQIEINTAFYSTSEMKALTNYVSSILPSYFPNTIPVTVSLYGSN
ncbi:MAG: CamS family sex pheromone protein, partial [Lactobacillaceae bacterium]|nr:CamS family sex pheromone protein [Lactobacillaceae bacterium]